jgi:hypothetical protein
MVTSSDSHARLHAFTINLHCTRAVNKCAATATINPSHLHALVEHHVHQW